MFRFVADQARSVGTFVSKVLSPRAAAADRATHSGLDTALSSSAFDEKLEEAAAESTPRGVEKSGVLGVTGSAFLGAAPGPDGENEEGSQPVAKPETPKLTPPTPKATEGGPEAAVSKKIPGGVNADALGGPPKTPNARGVKRKSSKKEELQEGEGVDSSVRGMKRLADLGDEKLRVKRGKMGVKEVTFWRAKAAAEEGSGRGKKQVPEEENVRTPEVKKRTQRVGKKAGKGTATKGKALSGTVKKGAPGQREIMVKGGEERTPKSASSPSEMEETRTPRAGKKASKTAEQGVSEIGVNEGPTTNARGVKAAAKAKRKETPKGGDKTRPAKARKTTAKGDGKGTPKAKGDAARKDEKISKTAGVKRKAEDEATASGGKTSGGGKGKAAKRAGGQELEYLGKRIKVLWEKGVVQGVRKDTWFEGLVTSYNSESRLHGVQYDDGDYEDEDLSPASPTKFELLG